MERSSEQPCDCLTALLKLWQFNCAKDRPDLFCREHKWIEEKTFQVTV
jgi:hypothetical protein